MDPSNVIFKFVVVMIVFVYLVSGTNSLLGLAHPVLLVNTCRSGVPVFLFSGRLQVGLLICLFSHRLRSVFRERFFFGQCFCTLHSRLAIRAHLKSVVEVCAKLHKPREQCVAYRQLLFDLPLER